MGDFLKLQYELRDMEQELKIRTEQNAELYAKLCNALTQLEEANKVIKKINSMSGNVDLSPLPYKDRRKVDGITTETYEYLKKWGVE